MKHDLTRILLVDDDPHVLESLSLNLRKHFDVTTANGGVAGLVTLKSQGPFALVVSDMRMPVMNGAVFLKRAREESPDTVRLLLTGQADLDVAVAAINEGGIFRFLLKPCPLETLLLALQAAAEQHRLVMAERVLLEQTLHGSIKMLAEILALANPTAYGRAMRLKQRIGDLADHVGLKERWHVEVAAMLSQVGYVTLPPATVEKLYAQERLNMAEQQMVSDLPEVTNQLLANIPRMEPVQEILAQQHRHFDGTDRLGKEGGTIPWGARAMKIVLDYDALENQGFTSLKALNSMKGRSGTYDPELFKEFEAMIERVADESEQMLSLSQIRVGMIFAEDVRSASGSLLISRGHEATASLLARLKNYAVDLGIQEPLRMRPR